MLNEHTALAPVNTTHCLHCSACSRGKGWVIILPTQWRSLSSGIVSEAAFLSLQHLLDVTEQGYQSLTHRGIVNAVGFLPSCKSHFNKCYIICRSHNSEQKSSRGNPVQCCCYLIIFHFKMGLLMDVSHPSSVTCCCLLQPPRECRLL